MFSNGKPPQDGFSDGNAMILAPTSYKELIPKEMGPFTIVIVHPNTLSIFENGVHNTVSINRAMSATATDHLPFLLNIYMSNKTLREVLM